MPCEPLCLLSNGYASYLAGTENGMYREIHTMKSDEDHVKSQSSSGKVVMKNNRMEFSCSLKKSGPVGLYIMDCKGRIIHQYYTDHAEPGRFTYTWGYSQKYGKKAGAALYFLNTIIDKKQSTQRIVVVH